MTMRLTAFSIRKKASVLAILLGLIILGGVSFRTLPVNFLPDLTYPLIRVSIIWPGATPGEIDRSIADPVERLMASVDGVDYLESRITEGNYRLEVNFHYGIDVNVALQDTAAAMGRVTRLLPDDIDPPMIIKADPSMLPVLQIAITSKSWSTTRIRTWVEDQLQKQLLAVSGVAGTEIVGGQRREIRIYLRPESLLKYKLTVAEVQQKIAEENVEMFAGRLIDGRRHWVVRTLAEFESMAELRDLVLIRGEKAQVTLGDIADVEDAAEDVRLFSRLNGKPAIKLNVTKQPLANTVEVARAVMEKLRTLQPDFPADVQLTVLEDQAVYVEDAISGVRSSAIGAALLVVITIFLFLGSLRHVLVLILAIPVILLINFAVMKLAGFSLNIFSLGGLVVAIGVLLDNSTVVLENLTRLRRLQPDKPFVILIPEAVSEVGSSLIAGTLSFLALFLPFLFVPGLTSLLFKELILVISGIVIISVLVAVTLTPLLADALISPRPETAEGKFHSLFLRITHGYARATEWMLRTRRIWLVVMLLVLAAGAWTWRKLDGEFLPTIDDGRVMLRLRLLPGASVYDVNELSRQVETLLDHEPRVRDYFTAAGGVTRGPLLYESTNEGEITVQLKTGNGRIHTEKWINQFRKKVGKLKWPGARIMVMHQRIRGIKQLGETDLEIKVQGQHLEELQKTSAQMLALLTEHPNFTNTQISLDFSKPELQIRVDRAKCAALGLSASEVAKMMRTYLGGTVVTSYRDQGMDFDVRLSVPEHRVRSTEDLKKFPLTRPDGAQILLSDVARVEPGKGPVEIIREDQTKEVVITADTVGTTISDAQDILKDLFARVPTPPGVTWKIGGQALMMNQMQVQMLIILLFALLLAGIVLTVQFNEWKLPLVILANLPFCLVGVLFGLELAGFPVGATVLIGMLVVVAATINDGVLLYTFAEELRRDGGHAPHDAILEAASVRLRPRVMTTLTTLVGFIPLALNLGGGNEMLQPMAAGAIGGLVMEFFAALFLMPILYRFVYRR